jgi:hypothetical protein
LGHVEFLLEASDIPRGILNFFTKPWELLVQPVSEPSLKFVFDFQKEAIAWTCPLNEGGRQVNLPSQPFRARFGQVQKFWVVKHKSGGEFVGLFALLPNDGGELVADVYWEKPSAVFKTEAGGQFAFVKKQPSQCGSAFG